MLSSFVSPFRRSALFPATLAPFALAFVVGFGSAGCQRPAPGPSAAEASAPAATAPVAEKAAEAAPLPPSHEPAVAVGRQGAVSSAEAAASDVGIAIMKKGGNAVDAAVAVGFALGVTHPTAGNMGGGGFMVIHLPSGESAAIDYREVAPKAASRDMYLDDKGDVGDKGRVGPLAAGIPGVVAGLAYAHEKYGKLPWAELIQPSIALARDGHALDEFHAKDMEWVSGSIAKYAGAAGKANAALGSALQATTAALTKTDGSAYRTGDVWKQPDLATTLELIAKEGPDAFYKGAFAERMAARVREMGGIWTTEDLASYKAVEREVVSFPYRGHQVITMPPPSAGGVVLRQILAASETLSLERLPWDSVERIHYYVEALR
ncbi:MAG TPA: gamma-glutamyltransferase, partial [Polyangiaceae bacterium]|nr:gamma-glutamyltransferase [Polyangiaceae bacterium]